MQIDWSSWQQLSYQQQLVVITVLLSFCLFGVNWYYFAPQQQQLSWLQQQLQQQTAQVQSLHNQPEAATLQAELSELQAQLPQSTQQTLAELIHQASTHQLYLQSLQLVHTDSAPQWQIVWFGRYQALLNYFKQLTAQKSVWQIEQLQLRRQQDWLRIQLNLAPQGVSKL